MEKNKRAREQDRQRAIQEWEKHTTHQIIKQLREKFRENREGKKHQEMGVVQGERNNSEIWRKQM